MAKNLAAFKNGKIISIFYFFYIYSDITLPA